MKRAAAQRLSLLAPARALPRGGRSLTLRARARLRNTTRTALLLPYRVRFFALYAHTLHTHTHHTTRLSTPRHTTRYLPLRTVPTRYYPLLCQYQPTSALLPVHTSFSPGAARVFGLFASAVLNACLLPWFSYWHFTIALTRLCCALVRVQRATSFLPYAGAVSARAGRHFIASSRYSLLPLTATTPLTSCLYHHQRLIRRQPDTAPASAPCYQRVLPPAYSLLPRVTLLLFLFALPRACVARAAQRARARARWFFSATLRILRRNARFFFRFSAIAVSPPGRCYLILSSYLLFVYLPCLSYRMTRRADGWAFWFAAAGAFCGRQAWRGGGWDGTDAFLRAFRRCYLTARTPPCALQRAAAAAQHIFARWRSTTNLSPDACHRAIDTRRALHYGWFMVNALRSHHPFSYNRRFYYNAARARATALPAGSTPTTCLQNIQPAVLAACRCDDDAAVAVLPFHASRLP